MELVYLWVEEYKNIKQQGFNFSPRFNCNYNEDTNELTIDEKEYISIFPDNINITAIVGENGSGKSGLVKYFAQYFSLFLNKKFDYFFLYSSLYIMIYFNKTSNQFHILWSTLNSIQIFNNTRFNVYSDVLDTWKSDKYVSLLKSKQYEEIQKLKNEEKVNSYFNKEVFSKNYNKLSKNSFILHYDYSFDMFSHYQNNKSCILSVPNKEYNIYQHHNYDKTLLVSHIVNKKYIDNSKYFEPKKISIIPLSNVSSYHAQFKDELNINDLVVYLINSCIFSLLKDRHIKINDNNKNLVHNPIELKNFIEKNLQSIKSSFIEKDMKEIPLSYELEDLINYLDVLKKNSLENIVYIEPDFNELNINIEYLTENNISILTALPSKHFKLQISSNDNVDYDDLSNGEKSILRVRFYIENAIEKFEKNNYFILLDEPDNELHPQWQKKLLIYLLDIFKDREQTFHFIITSHSPFILSDMPKENIIFLEKGKQVYPLKDREQTFGANIHTLLSHGFFMKDGLMGEFAKEKIDKVIQILKDKRKKSKKNIEYCENIISLIGEPVLKSTLENMLEEKIESIESKEDKINRLKEQQKKLQDEIEKLES